MRKELKIAIAIFVTIFIIDQIVKYGFANLGWDVNGPYMSLKLAYNYGVAFSMFSFLEHYLKFIQLGIVLIATIYLYKNKNVFEEYLKYIQLFIVFLGTIYIFKNSEVFYKYHIAIALLYAGGLSNILDRFTYGAVVDYFYWHYMFEFAIFNFADVMIDLAVVIIIFMQIRESRREKRSLK